MSAFPLTTKLISPQLRALHRQDQNQTYVNHLLAAFENEQRPANTAAPPRVAVASASPAYPRGSPLIEPLTGRELEILHLLADGLNNEQIAGQLFITIGTVKTHLHRIYGKLDVKSRTQAVARARTLRLF